MKIVVTGMLVVIGLVDIINGHETLGIIQLMLAALNLLLE